MADSSHDNNEWRERIDDDVRHLGERMAGVESGIKALGISLDRFIKAFDTMGERQQELLKTRWPVIFGVLSLVAIVLGAFASGYVRDLNRIETSVQAIQSNRISFADPVQDDNITRTSRNLRELEKQVGDHQKDGHPGRVDARINDLADRVAREIEHDSEHMAELRAMIKAMNDRYESEHTIKHHEW